MGSEAGNTAEWAAPLWSLRPSVHKDHPGLPGGSSTSGPSPTPQRATVGLVSAFLAQPCSPWGPGGESSSREWEGGDEWPWGGDGPG